MCNECCREFRAWCKSFTRAEAWLVIVEAILLVICIAFLIFLILHLIVCYNSISIESTTIPSTTTTSVPSTRPIPEPKSTTSSLESPINTTVAECTWVPSKKTPASTHYYETNPSHKLKQQMEAKISDPFPLATDIDQLAFEDESDGEDAEDIYGDMVLALVRITPPSFGCILTAISEQWALTAASCIEDINELDSFVMMEGYGLSHGRTHAVTDVQIHPQYDEDRRHDLAALRSQDRLRGAVQLPSVVDNFLITIGEQFTLLGFGGFRTILKGESGRRLREVTVYSLPWRLCAGNDTSSRGARPAGGALCAGALYARGAACHWCAGSPLLRARTRLLAGVMARNPHCALSCEPAVYVSVAGALKWIRSLIETG